MSHGIQFKFDSLQAFAAYVRKEAKDVRAMCRFKAPNEDAPGYKLYNDRKRSEAYGREQVAFMIEGLVIPPKLEMNTKVEGGTRWLKINGQVYRIIPNPLRDSPVGQDPYKYILPNGDDYTHPTREGALLMCLKHAAGLHDWPWPEWED